MKKKDGKNIICIYKAYYNNDIIHFVLTKLYDLHTKLHIFEKEPLDFYSARDFTLKKCHDSRKGAK